jgi:hypothetical protein
LEIALAGTVTNPNGYLNLVLKNDLSDKHLTPHGKFAVCLGAAIQIGSTGFLLYTPHDGKVVITTNCKFDESFFPARTFDQRYHPDSTEQFHVRVSSNFPESPFSPPFLEVCYGDPLQDLPISLVAGDNHHGDSSAGDAPTLAEDDFHDNSSVKDNAVALSAAGDVRDFSARNPSVTLQSALHKDPEQPTSSLSVRFDESAQHNITPSDSLARTKDHAHHTWQKIGSSILADAADRELVEFYSSFWY